MSSLESCLAEAIRRLNSLPDPLDNAAHVHMHRELADLASIIGRHAMAPISECALPRVTLIRADAPQEALGEMLAPVVCLVVRGTKRVQLGSRHLTYGPGTCVVSALDFPITGHIVEVPYRAAALHLDVAILSELLQVVETSDSGPSAGFSVGEATPDITDALLRLLRLLDRPQDRSALADAAEREVLFRVLRTSMGPIIRQFALERHIPSRVEPAIRRMRDEVARPVSIGELAELSHLSPSSLHRHFKAATGSTPLQFQKQIRLQEARRLLLIGQANAAGAAARVGYASPTQFNREYARLFGTTPGRDAASLGLSSTKT